MKFSKLVAVFSFVLCFSINSDAQFNAIEISAGPAFPTYNLRQNFGPGYAINGLYYFDEQDSYSIYSGISYMQFRKPKVETGAGKIIDLSIYTGGLLNFQVSNTVKLVAGMELGYGISINYVNLSASYQLGAAPKTGVFWRVNDGFFSLNAQFKYSAYLNLWGNFNVDNFGDAIHQTFQPALGITIYI